MSRSGGRRSAMTTLLAILVVATLAVSGTVVWRELRPARVEIAAAPPTSLPSVDPSPEPPKVPRTPVLRLPNRDLRRGDQGRAVRILQDLLDDLHYDIGTKDGRFGDDTHHAVVAFQKVNGLARDGVVGASTRRALASPEVPRPLHPRRKGTSIEIDLTRQVVYLLNGGRIERILDTSTGGGYTFYSRGVQKVANTETGEFEIYLQYDGWYESSVGPMYRSSFYLRGFAIHGAKSVPPYPASHGCARVTMAAIDRLWPELEIGTKVSVYRS